MSALGIPAAPIAAAASAGAATVLVATKAKIAAAAAIFLVAGAFGWRWTHPPESRPEPDRGSVGRGAGPMVAAAPAAQDAGPGRRGSATRPGSSRGAARSRKTGRGPRTTRIVGEIVDDDTGKPLEGAEVSLLADRGRRPHRPDAHRGGRELRASDVLDGRLDDRPGDRELRASDVLVDSTSSGSRSPRAIACAGSTLRPIGATAGVTQEQPRRRLRHDPDRARRGGHGTYRRSRRSAAGRGSRALPPHEARLGPLDGLSAVGRRRTDGSFALPERLGANGGNPPPFLIAVHPAGIDWVRVPVVKGQERVSFEILARDGLSATVRTLDAAGRPLEGALVLAVPTFPPFGDDIPLKSCPERPDLPAADSPLAAFANRILRMTGADGAASFSGLPEGRDDPWFGPNVANRIVFYAFREGFEAGRAELDLASRTESVTIALTPSRERAITGVVRDESGSPVAGASVSYANRPPPVLTNSAGEYRIPADLPRAGMPDPPVAATAPGFAWAMRYATVTPGEPDPTSTSGSSRPSRSRSGSSTKPDAPSPDQRDALPRAEGRIWSLPMERRNATAKTGPSRSRNPMRAHGLSHVPSSGDAWEPVWPRTVFGGESVEIVLHPAALGRASVTAEVVDESTGEPVAVAGGAVLPAFDPPRGLVSTHPDRDDARPRLSQGSAAGDMEALRRCARVLDERSAVHRPRR